VKASRARVSTAAADGQNGARRGLLQVGRTVREDTLERRQRLGCAEGAECLHGGLADARVRILDRDRSHVRHGGASVAAQQLAHGGRARARIGVGQAAVEGLVRRRRAEPIERLPGRFGDRRRRRDALQERHRLHDVGFGHGSNDVDTDAVGQIGALHGASQGRELGGRQLGRRVQLGDPRGAIVHQPLILGSEQIEGQLRPLDEPPFILPSAR